MVGRYHLPLSYFYYVLCNVDDVGTVLICLPVPLPVCPSISRAQFSLFLVVSQLLVVCHRVGVDIYFTVNKLQNGCRLPVFDDLDSYSLSVGYRASVQDRRVDSAIHGACCQEREPCCLLQ